MGIYSNLGESCHHACFRAGDARGETWYCDDRSLFNIDQNLAMDGTDVLGQRRCSDQTSADGSRPRSINRNKSAWAPYMRADGKCFYAHFRGKHKCFITRTNNYRLCGCEKYSDLFGRDYVKNPSIVPVATDGTGWHVVSDINCNNYCKGLGLTCGEDEMNDFKGAYDMMELEKLLTDGAMGMCAMYDDRLEKKKNPSFRDSDNHCYVNYPTHGGDAACNLVSRDPDYRFCYCN